MEDRLVSPKAGESEQAVESSLRPKRLEEYIGQDRIKDNLNIFLEATKARGDALEHVLLYGPPGLGKTTLANIIAAEMQVNLRTTSGPATGTSARRTSGRRRGTRRSTPTAGRNCGSRSGTGCGKTQRSRTWPRGSDATSRPTCRGPSTSTARTAG